MTVTRMQQKAHAEADLLGQQNPQDPLGSCPQPQQSSARPQPRLLRGPAGAMASWVLSTPLTEDASTLQ